MPPAPAGRVGAGLDIPTADHRRSRARRSVQRAVNRLGRATPESRMAHPRRGHPPSWCATAKGDAAMVDVHAGSSVT